MRALSITLFILGLFWAYCLLGLLFVPICMFFAPEADHFWSGNVLGEILLPVVLWANVLVGYWVWWGWLTRFRLGVFPRNYLKISLIHHGICLLVIPLIIAEFSLSDLTWPSAALVWLTGAEWFPMGHVILGWIVANMVVCAACILRSARDPA